MHLMAFQESVEGIPNNTNNRVLLPRSKRSKIYINPAAESALPSINKNAEPNKLNQIIEPNSVRSRSFSLHDLWLLFRKWNSVGQSVPIFSGWLMNIWNKHSTNLIKTTETYSPPIWSKVTDFSSIHKYIEYLQSLARSVNMPYTNITLDVGAAINEYKFLWNTNDMYDNVIIYLASFHFIKENFQVRYSCFGKSNLFCTTD